MKHVCCCSFIATTAVERSPLYEPLPNASIARLKRILFGPRSDSRTPQNQASVPETEQSFPATTSSDEPSASAAKASTTAPEQTPRKPPGHGRRKASDYTGAQVVPCTDPTLQVGDRCPHCAGHLYDTHEPSIFIRLTGQPVVGATRYEQQVLRCSGCQERFTAPLPEGVTPQKCEIIKRRLHRESSQSRLMEVTISGPVGPGHASLPKQIAISSSSFLAGSPRVGC